MPAPRRSARVPGRRAWRGRLGLALCSLLLLAACRQDMHNQPKYEPFEHSAFFPDGRASRHLVPGTIPRGHLETDELFYTGTVNGKPAPVFPFPITRAVLERGRERYDVFCAPCHDRVGTGRGMIVERGYKQPPSFHLPRLRSAPPGYFFRAITDGFGTMPSYAAQIPLRDRWAIVAYLRALQLSQHARLEDVPPAARRALEGRHG